MYDEVKKWLAEAYDERAAARDAAGGLSPWKEAQRAHFLALLQAEKKQTLLEVGAGHGRDSLFFQQNGLDVIATDLSAEMVKLCQAKGLTAYQMDFLNLDFPDLSFDALFAMNSLLHVPKSDLATVLKSLKQLLKPTGLFYVGVYGGRDFEGVWEEDSYEPKRFFSFYTDDAIRAILARDFDIIYFEHDKINGRTPYHQSIILRRAQSL